MSNPAVPNGSEAAIIRRRAGGFECNRLFSPVDFFRATTAQVRDPRPVLCDSWTGGPGALYTDGTIGTDVR